MAKDGKHIIHAGGVFPNPLLNREGAAAASTPHGTIGFFSATDKFTASVDGNEAAILYVANKDYLRCLSVDDAIPAGELVVGIQPLPGMFLNVRAAAGTYTKDKRSLLQTVESKWLLAMSQCAATSRKTNHTQRRQAICFVS